MTWIMPVLVQQPSSTSISAVRMIRAAIFNIRFKCNSGACVEIEGVAEISEFIRNTKKYSSTDFDSAGCGLLASRVDCMNLHQQTATLPSGVLQHTLSLGG